jgi:hypothetical protein
MPEAQRQQLAENARRRVMTTHTAAHRAALLESYVEEALDRRRRAERPARRRRPAGKSLAPTAEPVPLAVASSK